MLVLCETLVTGRALLVVELPNIQVETNDLDSSNSRDECCFRTDLNEEFLLSSIMFEIGIVKMI